MPNLNKTEPIGLNIVGKHVHAYSNVRLNDSTTMPTIVFIHGAAHDHSVWNSLCDDFIDHDYRIIAIDLPAHGLSEGPPLSTVKAMASWIMDVCDAMAVGPIILVGHSMGALVALEAAACYPNRISMIALLGIAYPLRVSDVLLDAASKDEPKARQMIIQWSYAHSGSELDAMRQENLQLMEQCPASVLHTDLIACNDYRDGDAAAAGVECPCLLVLGQQDMMAPIKRGESLHKAIMHSQLILIEGAGHSLMAEKPEGVFHALRTFIDSNIGST